MKKLLTYAFCAVAALSLSACSSRPSGESDPAAAPSSQSDSGLMSSFRDAFSIGKVPPMNPGETIDTWCPPVDTTEGGANIRNGTGSNVTTQISLRHFARECVLLPDNTVRVKVGLMGLVILGPAGRPGTIQVPVHITVKHGNTVIAQRTPASSVVISPETSRGEFIVVEENIMVPEEANQAFSIEIGLRGSRRQ